MSKMAASIVKCWIGVFLSKIDHYSHIFMLQLQFICRKIETKPTHKLIYFILKAICDTNYVISWKFSRENEKCRFNFSDIRIWNFMINKIVTDCRTLEHIYVSLWKFLKKRLCCCVRSFCDFRVLFVKSEAF